MYENESINRQMWTGTGVRLTAAILIGAVLTVWLFITLVTSWDTFVITQAFKLLRSTPVIGALGGCSDDKMKSNIKFISLHNINSSFESRSERLIAIA